MNESILKNVLWKLSCKGGIDLSEIIKSAMEVDRLAREEVEKAQEKKTNIHELLRERKEKIHNDYMKDVDQKVQAYICGQDESLRELEKQNKLDIDDAISLLQKSDVENHEDWVDSIVKNVVHAQD